MRFARTILVMLITLSVAMLPAAGIAAFKPQSPAMDMQGMEVSASGPMHHCCPGEASPSDKAMDDCGSMAACALKCFSYAGGVWFPLGYFVKLAELVPPWQSDAVHSQIGNPPFRPPRV
jgi:hypothetical protein